MVCDQLGKKRLYFDGAMGTMLQNKGLKLGEVPELFNMTHPETVTEIHRLYLESGSQIITTNTFGANRYKICKTPYRVEEIITRAVELVRKAQIDYKGTFVALDIGPSGKVLKPVGDVDFEEVYEVFKEQAMAGEKAGADLVLLETFTDLYELKAAVLAVKENTKLPIFATMSFEENGRTFFGTSLESMVLTLEALGVQALGINCSLGPVQLRPIVEKLMQLAHIPVMVQPNAGLPVMTSGKTRYDITPETFAEVCAEFASQGVSVLGGCCGTTPDYIGAVIKETERRPFNRPHHPRKPGICSAAEAVWFDDVRIIGERLNPTGKKLLQAALRKEDMDFVIREALNQVDQGAHILDVNMGMPEMDEVALLKKAVMAVQGAVNLPLQIDTSNVVAMEEAVRLYNGKPLINSVNGKEESLQAILPIAKKYGAAVLGLALDERGIPETAEERLEIAEKIVRRAEEIGIPREDLFIDCLVVTASAQQKLVKETLKAVRMVKEKLGVKTVLGISNVSFGLPQRPIINRNMLAMALTEGLDAPIMNPADQGMQETIAAYRVLMGKDLDAKDFIATHGQQPTDFKSVKQEQKVSIETAIMRGMGHEAAEAARLLLQKKKPLEVIEQSIVPALNEVGSLYEKQKIFLPQLMKSAESAKRAFEVLQEEMTVEEASGDAKAKKKVILATVFGDIHDIGKNIVKVIMENYHYHVIDLGKDVPKEKVLEAVKKWEVSIVGLSALMTTTVSSMKETIALLRQEAPEVKVIVGGAVLTPELATYVGADFYARDAMETVRIAGSL